MKWTSLNVDISLNKDNKNVSRKHLAERQRRARINSQLEEIQQLVINTNGNSKATVKPEKAEVLEKAVNYLQNFKTEKNLDTEYYKQGFNSCISALLGNIPLEYQEKGNLKGLRAHLESFLVDLTTEADAMAYATTMASSPYIQSPSANWYQQQTGRETVNQMNQSKRLLQNQANGTHYSAANDKMNCHSPNLLCSVSENPKWYSDWNTEMQMHYMETYHHQNYSQDVSPYDVFQGIKSVYSNYLEDEEGYHSSLDDMSPNQSKTQHVKHEVDEANSTQNISTPRYMHGSGQNPNNASSNSEHCVSKRSASGTALVQIKTEPCNTHVTQVGQNNPSPIWRPW